MNFAATLPYLSPLYAHQPIRYVVGRLLRSNQIDVDLNALEQKLAGHPYFPSLLSVSDILNELGVSHQAYKTEVGSLTASFTKPVLVFLTTQGGMYGVVERILAGKVKVYTEKGETHHYSMEEFSKCWNGVVLELEALGKKTETRSNNRDQAAYPASVRYMLLASWLLVLAFLLHHAVSTRAPAQTLLLFFNLAGVGVTWLLLLQHLNKHNVLVRQLCESSSNDGCNAVLSSSSSQLTSWLNMAEAGWMYFAGTTLLLLFFEAPPLYVYLAFLAPFFSVYAIFLQAFVIRQWCKLCLLVHGVLLASMMGEVWLIGGFPSKTPFPAFTQLVVFLLPSLVWPLIKPFILKAESWCSISESV